MKPKLCNKSLHICVVVADIKEMPASHNIYERTVFLLLPMKCSNCVVPENIHTPTTEGIGNSRGVGGSMAQEIPEGRRGQWLDKFPEGQLHVHVRHKCSKL